MKRRLFELASSLLLFLTFLAALAMIVWVTVYDPTPRPCIEREKIGGAIIVGEHVCPDGGIDGGE